MAFCSIEEIQEWVHSDDAIGCTHMLVVCDTFDYEYYPVYVKETEDVLSMIKIYSRNMQMVKEVYKLTENLDLQLQSNRTWNI